MNFLAHLYLGPQAAEPALGSVLGDFVKGPVPTLALPVGVREGIWLHRRIDGYTDQHPLVLRSKQRISPLRRRYAGILVDMYYDHLLARHWSRFHPEPLDGYAAGMYRHLLGQRELMPERARRVIELMAEHDWLSSYAQLDNLHGAVDNLARRLSRENALPGGVAELEADYAGFEADFLAFMPDVQAFVAGEFLRLPEAASKGTAKA
ncbi:acyl carrier protein phosphodiesterase [Halopseudomonas salegens]|uniref:Acyl carrier protein phosphodiesterase n=1 Tax=Halopseudomonas salegens TaxID=1434072 RepID=A0A1H2FWT9_9GAMM|nr:ACP phosphodiesterase [Halopseudomonas salegens]SDU11814.1 Acyl carrier protein phosphodiesterase [Halopseudomonas salegens]